MMIRFQIKTEFSAAALIRGWRVFETQQLLKKKKKQQHDLPQSFMKINLLQILTHFMRLVSSYIP